MGVPRESLHFTYKGATLTSSDSPASLGMSDDNNTIQVSLTGQERTKEKVAQACTAGSVSAAVRLLSDNSELCRQPLNWFDSDGQEMNTPPIFIAIDYGHCDLVTKILPLHKDVIDTLKDGDGNYSALQWASWLGKLDIVRVLIQEGGAKVDEEALSLAREYNHDEVASLLLDHADLYSGLEGDADAIMEKACREGDVNRVQALLEEAYEVEKWKDKDGNYLSFSPMHFAVRNGHMDVIQLFAEKGVTVDLNDGR